MNLSPVLISRLYAPRSAAVQVLLLSSGFSMLLLGARILYTGHVYFLFLAWNLFLAFLPYAFSSRMSRQEVQLNKTHFLFFSIIWLLFIPNAFYIMTDLFHLGSGTEVPLWFDLALLLSFAWSGLLFGIISVRQMEKHFEKIFDKKFDLLFILPVMTMNALGIYIGRYLRFNSWDVITNPLDLASEVIYLFLHPVRNRFDWSMIACYSLLMSLFYFSIKRLSKHL
jgi:uncharacterized membrane protein